MITHKSRVYSLPNKQYNYSLAFYQREDKSINPKLIMRFDCHKINDLQCIKLNEREARTNIDQEQSEQEQLLTEY